MQHVLFIVTVFFVSFWNNLDTVECNNELKFWSRPGRRQEDENIGQHGSGKQRVGLRSNGNFRRNTGTDLEKRRMSKHRVTNAIFDEEQTNKHAKLVVGKGKSGKSSSHWVKEKTKPILRSTRITPMQLMQQDEGTTTFKYVQEVDTYEEYDLSKLNTYSIEEQMEKLLAKYKNVNSTVEVLGQTEEYNDLVLLKLSEKNKRSRFRTGDDKYVDELPGKKIVFIVHGLSSMGFDKLDCLSGSRLDHQLHFYINHLDQFDIFLMPLANPDGYNAVRKITGWNKNYSPQKSCNGVMLDRNFDVSWNSSNVENSCSQFYPGPVPFSEIETSVIRNVFHHFSHRIVAYMHVHAGESDHTTVKGDAILYPRGFTDTVSDDDKYIDLKAEVDEAMRNASFQVASVQFETLHNWYGKVFGSSVDYASSIYGIPYSMELVMQIYPRTYPENIQWIALDNIWRRTIDVIFDNIYRSTTSTNEDNTM